MAAMFSQSETAYKYDMDPSSPPHMVICMLPGLVPPASMGLAWEYAGIWVHGTTPFGIEQGNTVKAYTFQVLQ